MGYWKMPFKLRSRRVVHHMVINMDILPGNKTSDDFRLYAIVDDVITTKQIQEILVYYLFDYIIQHHGTVAIAIDTIHTKKIFSDFNTYRTCGLHDNNL